MAQILTLELEAKAAQVREFLSQIVQQYGRVVYANSLGAEAMVLTDIIANSVPEIDIVSIDTGRLHEETYELLAKLQRRYDNRIRVIYPDGEAVSDLVTRQGINGFFDSPEARSACCGVRKVVPFRKIIDGYAAWVTGVRREQSKTRAEGEAIEWDAQNGLQKVSPLLDWSEEQIWAYIRARKLPFNSLHEKGYPSIGCAPCTRAIMPGEDQRAGRWWWEQPEQRECGLHPKARVPALPPLPRLDSPPAAESEWRPMDYLPIFLRVQNRLAVVIGGGAVAARKTELLLNCGAQVRLIAPELAPATEALLRLHGAAQTMSHLCASFEASHLEGAALVIAATDSESVNAQVSQAARMLGIPVNVADDAEHSDFILPAFVDRSPVIVAVSSAGTTPVLARRVREQIEALLPSRLGPLARFAGQQRERVNRELEPAVRRQFWERFFGTTSHLQHLAQDETTAQQAFDAELAAFSKDPGRRRGEVYLIGCGPGDPDLLTLRALQLLQQADVLLYDRLVAPAILERARREATRVFVGKDVGDATLAQERINDLLLEHARRGLKVARLKGGDPFIFGRGGEEIAALAQHGIAVTVVPGITSALGAAASAQIPLTLREVSQSVTFAPGHVAVADTLDWPALARSGHTVVFYMAMAQLAGLTQRLQQAGAPADRPVALIAQATLPTQRVVHGKLADIAETARTGGFGAPALLFVGEVTRVVQQQALASLEPCLVGVA